MSRDMYTDEYYMRLALQEAQKALLIGEVPVGAVIVWDDGRIVARAHNTRETEKNALHHAECKAIDMACNTLNGWRLHKATMYVTLEPCPMCAGAIIGARIKRVVFAACDTKAGAFGSVLDLNCTQLNHHPLIESGLCEKESAAILNTFFTMLRDRKKKQGE